ncbi:MAG: type II toxin-antitoxin system VapC family toxin [Chthoniobacterales bacterium]|nr:type II toxin-antitoxin system VapC family toxin [Chthoniobacterales bacterium]
MITAVDSNVLIDVIGPSSRFAAPSIDALDSARARGALVICSVVAAEIAAYFATAREMEKILSEMSIRTTDLHIADLYEAGTAYVAYRQRRTKPKDRMLADFLVGAHALRQADALLTRDRGYYRTYFPRLKLVDLGE